MIQLTKKSLKTEKIPQTQYASRFLSRRSAAKTDVNLDKFKKVVASANILSGWCAKNRDEKARFERPLYCTRKPSPTATPKHNPRQSAKSAVKNSCLRLSDEVLTKADAFVVKKRKKQLVQKELFIENKANPYHGHPARGLLLTLCITKGYTAFQAVELYKTRQKNKAKQSQFKPNFELKLALFSRNKPKTPVSTQFRFFYRDEGGNPIFVKIGNLCQRQVKSTVSRIWKLGFRICLVFRTSCFGFVKSLLCVPSHAQRNRNQSRNRTTINDIPVFSLSSWVFSLLYLPLFFAQNCCKMATYKYCFSVFSVPSVAKKYNKISVA